MTTGNALKDYKRLLTNFTYSSLAESRGEAEKPVIQESFVEEARPVYPSMPSGIRKLAGMGDSEFSSWTRSRRPLSESRGDSESLSELVTRFKKIRVINIFEDERMSGPLLPSFDWKISDELIEAAQKGAIRPEVAKSHIRAVMSSNVADKDRHSSASVAHKAHSTAAESHHMASRMMKQAGDSETASKHDAWAKHHEAHAKHFKAMDASHTAKAFDVRKSPGPDSGSKSSEKAPTTQKSPETKKAPEAKKAEPEKPRPIKKHDTVVAPKGATIHWRPEHGNQPEPTKPTKTPEKKVASAEVSPSKPSKAQNLTYAAHAMAKDKTVPHKELHDVHMKAAHSHMVDAVKHFRSGNHEQAQHSFNAAMHNAGKAKHHKETGLALSQTSAKRASEPEPGPRATVGKTASSPNNNGSNHRAA